MTDNRPAEVQNVVKGLVLDIGLEKERYQIVIEIHSNLFLTLFEKN